MTPIMADVEASEATSSSDVLIREAESILAVTVSVFLAQGVKVSIKTDLAGAAGDFDPGESIEQRIRQVWDSCCI
jgi:hypothetical protein